MTGECAAEGFHKLMGGQDLRVPVRKGCLGTRMGMFLRDANRRASAWPARPSGIHTVLPFHLYTFPGFCKSPSRGRNIPDPLPKHISLPT